MRVALLQYPIVWADPESNLSLWADRLRALKGKADVALLPEMCTTGFCPNRADLAESEGGRTIRQMQALADETDMMICGSYMVRLDATDPSQLANRGFILRPGLTPMYVDKHHLFGSFERSLFRPGEDRTVIEWRGVRFRYVICYDLRFPAWCRLDVADPYEVLLISANWPDSRIADWDILVHARGTENQAYVAAVNMVGDDGFGLHYNGHSVAYDTRHNDLVGFEENEAGTRIADFDMEGLRHFREKMPFWKDAD